MCDMLTAPTYLVMAHYILYITLVCDINTYSTMGQILYTNRMYLTPVYITMNTSVHCQCFTTVYST